MKIGHYIGITKRYHKCYSLSISILVGGTNHILYNANDRIIMSHIEKKTLHPSSFELNSFPRYLTSVCTNNFYPHFFIQSYSSNLSFFRFQYFSFPQYLVATECLSISSLFPHIPLYPSSSLTP